MSCEKLLNSTTFEIAFRNSPFNRSIIGYDRIVTNITRTIFINEIFFTDKSLLTFPEKNRIIMAGMRSRNTSVINVPRKKFFSWMVFPMVRNSIPKIRQKILTVKIFIFFL